MCAEGTDDAEWPRITPSSERQKPEGLAVPRDEAFLSGKRLTGFTERISVRLWESRATFLECITSNATGCTVPRDCEGGHIRLTLSGQLP